jgi:hypothetical protein
MLEVGDVVSLPNYYCIAECVKVDLYGPAYLFRTLVSHDPIYEYELRGWWYVGKFGVPDPPGALEKLRVDKKDLILYSYFPFKSRQYFSYLEEI